MTPILIPTAILTIAVAIMALNFFVLIRTINTMNGTIATINQTIRLQQEQISTLNIRLQVLEDWSRT